MKFVRHFGLLVATLSAMNLVGCGGAGGGAVPVEGAISLNGKPLAGATVTLQRTEGPKTGRVFRGEADAQGNFEITTADGRSTGAPPGDYHVFITSIKISPDVNETTKIPNDPVPQKWRDGSQMFSVPPGGTSEANFVITSR